MPTPLPRKTARRWNPESDVHYLTFSCYQRRPFFGDAPRRDQFVQDLASARHHHRFKLFAWVVMPEHIHIILMPTTLLPEQGSPLPTILSSFKGGFASSVLDELRRIPGADLAPFTSARGTLHFWQQGAGFDRNVRDAPEMTKEIRYIHHNPAKRGLVPTAVDWPWSSARWYAGRPDPSHPAIDSIIFDRHEFPGRFPETFLNTF